MKWFASMCTTTDMVGRTRRVGSGLLGLKDRAAAIGGTIFVDSPPGKGTSLTAELPLADHDAG